MSRIDRSSKLRSDSSAMFARQRLKKKFIYPAEVILGYTACHQQGEMNLLMLQIQH